MLNKVASVVSAIGHPLIMTPLIIGLILIWFEGYNLGIRGVSIILCLTIFPTAIWMFVKSKYGVNTNFDVSNQRQRIRLFVFTLPLLLITTLILYITNKPEYLYIGFLIGTSLFTISFLANYFIKSSLHVSINSYMAISISLINIPFSLALLFLTLIVAWSRLVLKRHSIIEVCVGLFLGVVFGIFFVIYTLNHPQPVNAIQNQLFTSDQKPCNPVKAKVDQVITLAISPKISFVDEPLQIMASGFTPSQVAALRVTVMDAQGMKWESVACFRADEFGQIDPSKQEPIRGGSYHGLHPMGLFWSLKPEKLTDFNAEKNLEFVVSVETGGHTVASETITRKSFQDLEALNIRRKEIRSELIGNLYLPNVQTKQPAVILLSGSGGNFQDKKASYLAAKGYAVLDLIYFGTGDLPEHLEAVPLEYLKKSIHYLKQHPNIDSSKIALMGRSKGAEYALLYASVYHDIKAVVSMVGSSLSWSSKRYFRSSWSYKNKEIPFARGAFIEAIRYLRISNGIGQDQSPYMISAFENEERTKRASIEIENIECPILLLSGKSDLQWPSSMMSDSMLSRAKKHQFPFEIVHYSYENAGHHFEETPYIPQVDFSNVVTWKSGGSFQGNALASIDSWQQTLAFLERNLRK